MIIAALDQSGGSSPGALARYGITDSTDVMYDIHQMRKRIVSAPAFNKDNFDGVILFRDTIERGLDTKGVPVFAKVDVGLDSRGFMNPFEIDWTDEYDITGTKMRSVVEYDDLGYIAELLDQQFEYAREINDRGLIPIVEPEVDINHPNKASIESKLAKLLETYDLTNIILKLTIPTDAELYRKFNNVVALSGGYTRQEACMKIQGTGMGASFSRALLEGLQYNMNDHEFNSALNYNIMEIRKYASKAN